MDQPEVKLNPPNVIYRYFASYNYLPGTQVQVTHLNPTPRPGLVYDVCTFVRWEGDATGTANPITITMDSNKSLVACYNVVHYDLRTPTPTGRVTATPTRPGTITPTPRRLPSLIPEYYISTGAATNITDTTATLGGSARLQGYTSVTISISYSDGTNTYFGGSGVATVSNPYVSVNVTGLKPDTQYSYYAYAGSGGPGGHNGERRYFRTLPADTTISPTPTPANTPTPTRSITPTPLITPIRDEYYAVSYVIQSDWGNGATISVTITNKTSAKVYSWILAWTFPGNQTITNLWNGTYTQSGTSVSVKDAGYNANIPANGGSVNFGFNLNYSGSNAKPASFTLNGTACRVQ
jgi:hypothetical protein